MTGRWAIIAAACLIVMQGCASRQRLAERIAARMLDPGISPREEIRLRERLIDLAPESEPYLASAFFPVGLYDVPESALAEVAAAGFNLVVNSGKDPSYLARAEAAGLRTIPYISLSDMAGDVLRARGRRSVFAWYLFDEPDLNDVSPEQYADLSRRLRRLDRDRPIYLTVLSPAKYAAYVGSADIISPNRYPILRDAPEENDLRDVARAVRTACVVAGGRPVWAVLQAFWAEPIWSRLPTPDELRAMCYLALNNGATGIIYFSFKSGDRPITEHAELWAAVRRINGELNALRGALLVRPMSVSVDVQTVEEQRPETAKKPIPPERPLPLDCSIRSFGGMYLLTAVNPDPWPKVVRIVLPDFAAGRRANEVFQGPTDEPLAAEIAASLELTFAPLQVRIFWIR